MCKGLIYVTGAERAERADSFPSTGYKDRLLPQGIGNTGMRNHKHGAARVRERHWGARENERKGTEKNKTKPREEIMLTSPFSGL